MPCSRRNFSNLKTFLLRHKWTVILCLIWIAAVVQMTIHNNETTVLQQTAMANLTQRTKGLKHYDVVLNSYMRGGSTLTGLVLGHRSDSFYVYEPLWKIARWAYWRGNDTICRSDRAECRAMSPEVNADSKFMNNKIPSNTGSLRLAQKVLYKIYDCQLNDFDRLVVEKTLTVKLGGPSWSSVKACIENSGQQTTCVNHHMPKICKNATHRVTKVLRLTPDNLEYLLHARSDLKIIHLFRDPRAIINSRIETKWYPTRDNTQIISNTQSLCKKMLYDFNEGQKLYLKYPDRFKFLYYEDLNDAPLEKVKTIYRYLGMTLDESKYEIVKKIKVFDDNKNVHRTEREKNTAFWWRKTLDWSLIQKIDLVCKDVYSALGYKIFKSSQEITNLTLKSVDIPVKYQL